MNRAVNWSTDTPEGRASSVLVLFLALARFRLLTLPVRRNNTKENDTEIGPTDFNDQYSSIQLCKHIHRASPGVESVSRKRLTCLRTLNSSLCFPTPGSRQMSNCRMT